jgi:hypothetical protein
LLGWVICDSLSSQLQRTLPGSRNSSRISTSSKDISDEVSA